MAYATPKVWVYNEQPTATEMNKYAANLTALALNNGGINWANGGHAIDGATNAESFIQHQRRYLFYQNESHDLPARITSASDPTLTYDLADIANDEGGLFDLEQNLAWLAPGMSYTIERAYYAFEVDL
jgi:hypothetical protein